MACFNALQYTLSSSVELHLRAAGLASFPIFEKLEAGVLYRVRDSDLCFDKRVDREIVISPSGEKSTSQRGFKLWLKIGDYLAGVAERISNGRCSLARKLGSMREGDRCRTRAMAVEGRVAG